MASSPSSFLIRPHSSASSSCSRPQISSSQNHLLSLKSHFYPPYSPPPSGQINGIGNGKFRVKFRVQKSGGAEIRVWASSKSVSAKNPTENSPSDDAPADSPRRLVLLRHAKSSWADPSLKDHDRPLSERGVFAAKNVAKRLAEMGWVPSLILCSDSLRTRQTLELMREAVAAFSEAEVRFLGSYYSIAAMDGQTAEHLHETVVKFAAGSCKTVMCMGHNRGWEEAASALSGKTVELKTANAALLESRKAHSDWEKAWKSGWRLKSIVKPEQDVN